MNSHLCAPPVQGAHMKMIVRALVFCPEKGGWKEEKENLPTTAHTGCMKSA